MENNIPNSLHCLVVSMHLSSGLIVSMHCENVWMLFRPVQLHTKGVCTACNSDSRLKLFQLLQCIYGCRSCMKQ